MKIRTDFVTNSSSSSFIIDRKDCTYGELLSILKKLAQNDDWCCYDDKFKLKDVMYDEETGEVSLGHYYISILTKDHPYTPYTGGQTEQEYLDEMIKYYKDENAVLEQYKEYVEMDKQYAEYNHHYLVDNHGNGRYDVDDVEDAFQKHGIPIVWGYCD